MNAKQMKLYAILEEHTIHPSVLQEIDDELFEELKSLIALDKWDEVEELIENNF